MSLGADIQYKMTALFSSAYDESSAKQVEQQAMAAARRAAEASEKEFEAAFRGFGDIINGALKQMKIQPIDIDELIKLPKSAAFSKLGTEFGAKFAKGFKGAVSSGGIDNAVMDQIKQLEQQKSQLLQRQKTLPKQISKYEDLMDISGAFEDEFHAFSKEELGKMGSNIDEVSQSMLEGLDTSLNHLSKLEKGTREFDQSLVDVYKRANDVFRMSRTLSKHPDLVSDKSILDDYDFESLQEIYNSDDNELSLMHYDRDFNNFIKRQQKSLDEIPTKIKEVDQQLTALRRDNPDIINVEQTKSSLKTLQEVEEAYKRILNAKGKVGKQGKNINEALEFDPLTSDKGIQSLYKQYTGLPEGSSWEVEYAALLRYVKLYESYLNSDNETHRNKVTKPHNEYTKLYEQLKPLAADAETSLRNVMNMANKLPLIDVDKKEAVDTGESDDTTKKAQEAQRLAEAEAKARIETEARTQAEREAAEAAEKEKIAKEAITKADIQKDDNIEDANLKKVKQDATEAEQAVENLNDALKETDNIKQGVDTSDTSSAELKAAQEEIERLRKEAADEEGRLNRERAERFEQLSNAKAEAEAAEKRAREAEEELTKIKADVDGKKLVDKDAPDDDSKLRATLAQLENESQMRIDTERALGEEVSARYAAEMRADEAQEEAEKLREQIAKTKTKPDQKKDIDVDTTKIEASQLKGVQEAVEAVTTAVNLKTKAFNDEGDVVGQVIGREVNALMKLSTQATEVSETISELLAKVKTVVDISNTAKSFDINVKTSADDGTKKTSTKSKGDGSSSNKSGLKQLEKDYEEVGRLWARLDDDNFLVQSATIENLESEIARKQKSLGLTEQEIAALKEKMVVAEQAENKIIQAEKEQAAKDKKVADDLKFAKSVEDLGKQYEKLGKLQAQGEAGDLGKAEEARQLATIIQQETEKLGLNKEQNAERLKSLQLRQQEAKASQASVLAAKQEKKNADQIWRDQVKAERGYKGVNAATSAVTAGNRAVSDVIGDASITSDIEAKARELQNQVQALAQLKDEVNRGIAKGADVDSDGLARQTKQVQELTEEMEELVAIHKKYSGDNAKEIGGDVGSFDNLGLKEYEKQLTKIAEANVKGRLTNTKFNAETRELTGTVKTGANAFTTYSFAVDKVDGKLKKLNQGTQKTEGFMAGIARKTKELAQYALSSISIYDVYNWVRQGVTYVKELDTAMTELRKVTDESEESYARFLGTASERASKVGTTVTNLVNSTADWARIGYSMEEAAKLAESTSVLLNVSEFGNIDEATSALTSTMQAFSYEADQSMHVVDIMNEIGNNYAISSDGIATALQDSASALMTANNSYEEAVAMVAAANKVVQDPSKVGGGLRTISLRLRGTKVEGEEDNDTVITSKSKLQTQIKGLSGVDILTDTGAYKSTYQILLEISRVWKDMNDMDQAALLEIIAGKNRSNIAASILNNQKDLEAAFASAQDAEGSALRENEKYMDSIQGKMDQFMNSLQTMWNNLISSDIIKNVVSLGTAIIDVIGDLGLFKILVGSLIAIPLGKWAITSLLGFEGLKTMLTGFGKWLITMPNYTKTIGSSMATLTKSFANGSISVGQFAKSAGSMLTSLPIVKIAAAAAAIAAVVAIAKAAIPTLGEQKEKFTEISNEVEKSESKLSSLQNQLEEVNAQIEELNSQESLSFTEEEELGRLQAQSAELERQIELTQALKKAQQKELNNEALETAEMYKDANFATGKGKGEYQEKGATIGGFVGGAAGGIGAAALGTKLGGSIGTFIGGPIGTAIGAALGAALFAVIGSSVGGAVADSQEQVGESIDNMASKYAELKQAHEEARQAYMDNPMDEDIKEDYQEAEKALADYQGAMSDRMSELQSYYDSIDLSVYDPVEDAVKIKELRNEMNEFYDTQDKWAIQLGSKNAKTNAINRIFGENAIDELKDVKNAMEEAGKAGKEISLEEAFSTAGLSTADLDVFIARLHEMGIYAYEVEEAFKRMSAEAEDAMSTDLYDASKSVGGAKAGVESISEALEKVKKEGYLTAEELDGMAETLGGAEALGDVWTHFAEVMSTNTSTLKEQREAAEALVETYLDNSLMQGGSLSPEEQHVMITQLQDMGVWNAREYVQDKNLENMYKEIQNSADYDWGAIQGKWEEIQKNWEDGSDATVQKIKASGLNEKKAWDDLTSDQKKAIAEATDEFKKVSEYDVQRIADEYGYELPLRVKMSDDAPQEIRDEIESLEKGGSVDLQVRPKVDAEAMNAAGWDIPIDAHATVNTTTFSNADETLAMNFTPILPDGTVMGPEAFAQYAQGVVEGVHDDYLKLQIGAEFKGDDAIAQAEVAAQRIHEIHESYLTEDATTQYVVDLMNTRNKKAEQYQNILEKEKQIGGHKTTIKQLDEVIDAYENLKKYSEEANWENLLYDRTAEQQWGFWDAELLRKGFNKEDFIKDFNDAKAMAENLQKDFPGINPFSVEDIKKEKERIEKEISDLEAELEVTTSKESKEEIKAEIENLENQIEALTPDVNIKFSYDLNKVKSDIESTKTAISESLSGTGMTEDSIKSIRAIYGEYRDYNEAEMFEKTANGIQVNIDALRDLQTQQEEAYKSELSSELAKEQAEYDRLTEAIKNSTSAKEMSNLMAERTTVEDNIKSLAMLQAQYEGLTSAHNKWMEALAGPDYGDRAEQARSNIEALKTLYNNEDYNTEKFKTGVEYLTGKDASTMTSMDAKKAWEQTGSKNAKRYLTENADGAYNMAEDLKKIGMASQDAEGNWTISIGNMKDAADDLGISVSMLDDIMDDMRAKGFKFDGDNLFPNLESFHGDIESVQEAIQKLTGEKVEVEFEADNIEGINTEIEKVKGILDQFEADAKAQGVSLGEVEGAVEAQTMLNYLIALKHEVEIPSVMTFSTAGLTEAQTEALKTIENIRNAYRDYKVAVEVSGPDSAQATQLKNKLDTVVSSASESTKEVMTTLGVDTSASSEEIASAVAALKPPDVKATITSFTPGDDKVSNLKKNWDGVKSKKEKLTVTAPGAPTIATLRNNWNAIKSKTVTLTTNKVENVTKTVTTKKNNSEARGTAFTSGTAFAGGNWGASKSGTALGGELGPEIVVRDGRWFTIGDTGAEFFHYKKDDIIFNAAQSQQILEKGKITTGNRRGRALSEGTAFAEGTAFVTGSGPSRDKPNTSSSSGSSSSSSSSNKPSSSSSSNSSSKKTDEQTELERITEWFDHQIDDLDHKIATNEKNINLLETQELEVSRNYYDDMISAESEKIAQNEQRLSELNTEFAKHTQYSEEWYNVRDAINATKEAIQDSKIVIEEYGKAIEELPLDKLEKNQELYDNYLSGPEHLGTSLENDISRKEALGEGVSSDYYKELIKNEETNLGLYQQQRDELIKILDTIPTGTKEWYEVRDAVYAVDEAMQESTTKAIEYGTSITEGYVEAASNIGDSFDSFDKLKDDQISSLEKYGDLLEARGELPTKELYETMSEHHQEKIDANTEEFNHLGEVLKGVKEELNPYEEGTAKWEAFEAKRAKAIVTIREQMRELKLDSQDSLLEIEKNKEAWKDTVTEAWDNVRDAYDNRDQYYENQKALAESYGDRLDILDINTPDSVYREQIRVQKKQNQNAKRNYLNASGNLEALKKEVGEDDPRYIEKYQETVELYQEWYDGENEVLELEQEMIDNRFDKFNQIIDRLDHSVEILQNVSSLMEREDVATEDGEWTAEGLTQLGMAYQQMEYNKQTVEEYSEKIKELERLYEQGEISEKKYTEQLQELEDGQWDAINSYEDMKDAIIDLNEARIDMIEEGIDKEVESYKELIDLKKEELEAERDLYDFRKNVQSQTKEISSLERRIASMSGSTDAATIAERTKLEAQLREAKTGLDDTYYGHAMDSQNQALDDEMEAFEESNMDYLEKLRESIKDTDVLIEQTYNDVFANSRVVLEKLAEISDTYGIEIDSNLTKPWERAQDRTLDFELAASNHITNVTSSVQSEESTLSESLGAPWKKTTSEDGPIQAYSWKAGQVIDDTIRTATQKQGELQSALYDGFKDPGTPLGLVDQYESDTTGAINAVKDAAVEASNAINQTSADLQALLGKYDEINSHSLSLSKKSQTSISTLVSSSQTNKGSNNTSTQNSGNNNQNGNVKALQDFLNKYWNTWVQWATGSSQLSVDGKYGAKTKSTIKMIQQELGITADGLYGSGTVKAMQKFYDDQMARMSAYPSSVQEYKKRKSAIPTPIYAKGTMGTTKDQFAITDEGWIGEEITLAAGKNGQLQYLKKGSAVMPADISANLVEWGKLNPDMMNIGGGANLNVISNAVNKPELNFSFDSLVHVDNCSQDTLRDLEKMVDTKINQFNKQLNQSLRKFK